MTARLAVLGLAIVAACGVLLVFAATRRAVLMHVGGRAGVAPRRALASYARGEYLYQRGARCAACHASDAGGQLVIRDAQIATLWGPNLTRGNPSVGQRYTDADFERAIRRGLRPDGQRLLAMPSWDDAVLSDADVASLIAYLRAAKPVVRDPPAFRLGLLGRLELVTGALAFDSDRIPDAPISAPANRVLAVARVAGCLRCHAVNGLSAPPPLPPERASAPMRSLPELGDAALAAALRDARAPGGRTIPEHVPPAVPAQLDDADVAAIAAYLHRAAPAAP